ncbi:MAG: hypothetical protein OEQ47_12190 [Acidimicrobiia bacterium]|nr:hypothetical protein [Acidimicrobiia bacterium]
MRHRIHILLALTVAVTGCTRLEAIAPDIDPLADVHADSIGDWSPRYEIVDGLTRFARTEGERLIVSTSGGDRDFHAGVNVGATVPGRFPGELAVDAATYRRWFEQMSDFGFTSIRVYTMLPPHFYAELRAHNLESPDRPLYLVHGAWPPEEEIVAGRDFWDPHVVETFRQELSDLVDVVHGNADIEERPGRAHGTYQHDVSPWLMAWAVGIEWDASAVLASDEGNAGIEQYRGRYFEATAGASPTENWLAMMLDQVAGAEASYGRAMPLAFVNWVTTDPLAHPEEPLEREDLVGVDPMHVRPTDDWPGGYFAGYHVYPYYPDFQRYEPGIADFVHDGRIDPYAGLLTKYREHHAGVPFVVLEFGVPTGMAKAHEEPHGRNQGDHTEQEQAAINADLLETIAEVGLAGGYVFAWTDEWFKLTWNTMDYELADRRAIWMNTWTNEAHFGLVASEPALAGTLILDGDGAEWAAHSQVIAESRQSIREVRVASDEGFLYFRLVADRSEAWAGVPIILGFDVIDGDGAGLGPSGAFPEADYRLVIDGSDARIEVRSGADPMLNAYRRLGFFPNDESEPGGWNLHRLITNRPYTLFDGTETEVEIDPAGWLHHGTTDPNDPEFDSRSTWFADDTTIEIRVPWQSIGFSDPSTRTVFDVSSDGAIEHVVIDRIGIAISSGSETIETAGYEWENWNDVTYFERLKAGSGRLAQTVIDLSR